MLNTIKNRNFLLLNFMKKCRLGVTIIISHQFCVADSRIVLGNHFSFWSDDAPVVIKMWLFGGWKHRLSSQATELHVNLTLGVSHTLIMKGKSRFAGGYMCRTL